MAPSKSQPLARVPVPRRTSAQRIAALDAPLDALRALGRHAAALR
jgi:hypothetical protein